MPTYTYEAVNAAGKTQKGTVDAGTTEEAIQRVKAQGFYPTSVKEQQVKKAGGVYRPQHHKESLLYRLVEHFYLEF